MYFIVSFYLQKDKILKKPIFIDEENCLDQASIVEFQLLMQKNTFICFFYLLGHNFYWDRSAISNVIVIFRNNSNERKVVKVCVCACVLWGRVFDRHWGNNFYFKFTKGTVTFWLPIHPHCSSNKMVMCKNLQQQKPLVAKRKYHLRLIILWLCNWKYKCVFSFMKYNYYD